MITIVTDMHVGNGMSQNVGSMYAYMCRMNAKDLEVMIHSLIRENAFDSVVMKRPSVHVSLPCYFFPLLLITIFPSIFVSISQSTGYTSSWAASNAHSSVGGSNGHHHWQQQQDHVSTGSSSGTASEEQPLTDLWENTKRTSPFQDLFERGRQQFRKHAGRAKASASGTSGTSGGDAWWTHNYEPPAESYVESPYEHDTSTTTSYHSATTSPGESTVREHFQRSADAFRRYGRAGAREKEEDEKKCSATNNRNRDQSVNDAFARSAETFRERERARAVNANSRRASQAQAQTTAYGEYASAANCPRDPSLANMFQRSVEDFERFGRAGSRPTTTPSGSYEAATEGCHTREIDDLFSRSAEKYVQNGGRRKEAERVNTRTNAAKTNYSHDTGGSAARVGKAAHPDDFFTNGRRTSETRPRSSRHPYEATVRPPPDAKVRKSSSGGVYAYSFGSAARSTEEARQQRPSPPPAPAAPQGPTVSQSYASMLREKEKALEAKIAALRQSEAEAQARYEASLAQEMMASESSEFDPSRSTENFAATASEQFTGNAVEIEVEENRVPTTTIRSESGSNIKFGINIIGGKNNNNNAAYLSP